MDGTLLTTTGQCKEGMDISYLTNERELSATEIVFSANDRCDQESGGDANDISGLSRGFRTSPQRVG
jgi:hypothetical protein